jgi:hypothetical protein
MGRSTAMGLMALLVCASASFPADIPKLKALFGTSAQRADYIMAIDTSQSMDHLWPDVVTGISEFTNSIAEGDHVAVILFDTDANNTRVLPRSITAKSKQDLRQELGALPIPGGKKTDFGRALRAVIAESSRPEANRLQFVFLFSDFEHDPPQGSEFLSRNPKDAEWQDLAARMKRAASDKTIQSFALMLPLGPHVGRDLALVRTVLGTLEAVPINNQDTLKAWFDRRRAEIERDKLRVLIDNELSSGWSIEAQPRPFGNVIIVKSHLTTLPVAVSVSGVSVTGFRGRPTNAVAVVLQPGQSAEIANLSPDGPLEWAKWLVTPKHVMSPAPAVRLDGAVEVQPSEEIGPALQIEPRRPLAASGRIEGFIYTGAPMYVQVSLALLLLAIFLVSWKIWLAPVVPVSRAFRKVILHGASHSEEIGVPANKKRTVIVGNTADADVKSKLSSPPFALRLIARRPVFPKLRPKRGIYASLVSGMVYYRTKRFDSKSRRWAEQAIPLPQHESQAIFITFQTKLSIRDGAEEVVLEVRS